MSSLEIFSVAAFAGAIIAIVGILWRALLLIAELVYFSLDDPIDELDEEIEDLKKQEEEVRQKLRDLLEETDDPEVKAKIRAALVAP